MSEPDAKKILRQHLEMDTFFSDGFTLKTEKCTSNKQSSIDTASTEHSSADDAFADLEQLAGQVRKCRNCRLGDLRTNAVPGEGNPKARIAFVGEAPGADEDAQGRPFVGRAGQLLDKIIIAMGLERRDVFIGNILKCRPPENRDPRPDEIISCLPFLQQQLEMIKPEIIVALGAHAPKTLLDTNKSIGQLRGRFHQYYSSLGAAPIKLMPTYHPAYLLRNYSRDNRLKVWEDMKRVLADLGLPVPKDSVK